MIDDKRFTGAVSIASVGGKSIVLATHGDEIVLVVPHAEDEFALSESEAWCLARQLDLACRRVGRAADEKRRQAVEALHGGTGGGS
jgi:hypothetical protein